MATENYRCSRHSMNLLHLAVGLIQGSSGECAGSEIRGRTPWRPRGPGCILWGSSSVCRGGSCGASVCTGAVWAAQRPLRGCLWFAGAWLWLPCVISVPIFSGLPSGPVCPTWHFKICSLTTCCLSQERSPWNQGQPAVTCLLLLPHQNHPGSKLADSLGGAQGLRELWESLGCSRSSSSWGSRVGVWGSGYLLERLSWCQPSGRHLLGLVAGLLMMAQGGPDSPLV